MKKIILFFATFLIIYGCQKDIKQDDSKPHPNISKKEYTWVLEWGAVTVNVVNNNNPYDSFGLMHNELFEYLATYPELFTAGNHKVLYRELMINFLDSINEDYIMFESDDYFDTINLGMLGYLNSYVDSSNLNQRYTDLYNLGKISILQRQYFLQLNSIAEGIGSVLMINNGYIPTTCQTVIDQIKSFENTILNDNNLSNDQSKSILATSSIMRYSIVNYADFLLNSSHPLRNVLTSPVINESTGEVPSNSIMVIGANWGKVAEVDADWGLPGGVGVVVGVLVSSATWGAGFAVAGSLAASASLWELYKQCYSGNAFFFYY